MTFVLDASAAAGWLMPDESPPPDLTDEIGSGTLAAPHLFWVELRNILLVGERRGRLPEGAADRFVAAVDDLHVELDTAAESAAVMALARRHRLTAYDALYLELALRRRAPLLTLDKALRAAAAQEGLPATP